jgi:hypothetical protein
VCFVTRKLSIVFVFTAYSTDEPVERSPSIAPNPDKIADLVYKQLITQCAEFGVTQKIVSNSHFDIRIPRYRFGVRYTERYDSQRIQ